MVVPQTNVFDVWILNGVVLLLLASMTRSGYDEIPWVIVTPAVAVVSVEEMADSFAQPLFLSATLRLMHSFLLMMPLLLPFVASSMVTALNWMFEAPVMQKFCDVLPFAGTVTSTVAGEP